MVQLKNKTKGAWNGDEYMQLKKRLGGLFLSIVIIFTGIIVNPLEVHAAGIEGYLAQADPYLAVDDPVQAMKVIVDAINTCGKDVRLVAKADDIRSHTFVTSKKVFMQNGELGVKPIPSLEGRVFCVRQPTKSRKSGRSMRSFESFIVAYAYLCCKSTQNFAYVQKKQ